MRNQAEKYKLCVSAFLGKAYISALDKKGHMTDNRRELSDIEVLKFIAEWSEAHMERIGNDCYTITRGEEPVLTIEKTKKK